jgi:hypothetical protein
VFSQYTLGYRDDSYDHTLIKTHLSVAMQTYIRKAIHRPWILNSHDMHDLLTNLHPPDVVQVAIIVGNAKMFAQILLSFRAFG